VKVLLTGATGFLGRHTLNHLAEPHDVVVLARRKPPSALRDLADWVVMDLAEPIDPARLPARVDAVVHLAQSERFREFPKGAPDVFAINVAGTFGLLEYARKARASRFIHASTGGVYRGGPEPLTEDAPLGPKGFYGASKAAAERLVEAYAGPLQTIVLRPFFLYGPWQSGMLIANLTERVLAGEVVEVRGKPGIRLSPTYVDDAASAFSAALEVEGNQICNVAGSEAVTLTELVGLIGQVSGLTPRLRSIEAPPGGDLVADTRMMRHVLGVAPQVSLREGIQRAVTAARAEGGFVEGSPVTRRAS
jgi:nucleoside-diphosphate-sugar epimerase